MSPSLSSSLLAASARRILEKEALKGEGGDGRNEENLTTTIITVIVILLILLTIAFEKCHHMILHAADPTMKPIIHSLFGELTVLGFLSLFTFCVTQMGAFEKLSDAIMPETEKGEENELLEIFEQVHFMLFLIMILFVVSVLSLVHGAQEMEREFHLLDMACRSEEYMKKAIWDVVPTDEDTNDNLSWVSFLCQHPLILRVRGNGKKTSSLAMNDHEFRLYLLLFSSLREEFLLDRSTTPPFEPTESKKALPGDFHFGRYLSICLANTLTHVVSLEESTWAFLGLMTVIYWGIMLLVKSDVYVLAWIWVGIGWLLLVFRNYFDYHIWKILIKMTSNKGRGRGDESMALVSASLPGWTKIDLDKFNGKIGKNWTRQDALYWRGRHGPKAYIGLYQIQLVFTSVYGSLLLLTFYPSFFSTTSVAESIIFGIVSLIPFLLSLSSFRQSAANMTMISSIGVHRRPQTIAQVLREEKTDQVIRSVVLMQKLQMAATSNEGYHERPSETHSPSYMQDLTIDEKLELESAKKSFKAMDYDSSGHLEVAELESLIRTLGFKLSDDALLAILQLLDADSDGRVNEAEFLAFYAHNILGSSEEHHHSLEHELHHLGRQVFEQFDRDGSGEITLSEFKSILESFNVGFSIDELGNLVNEIDEDNTGSIGEHEFVGLLEKHRHLFEKYRLPDL